MNPVDLLPNHRKRWEKKLTHLKQKTTLLHIAAVIRCIVLVHLTDSSLSLLPKVSLRLPSFFHSFYDPLYHSLIEYISKYNRIIVLKSHCVIPSEYKPMQQLHIYLNQSGCIISNLKFLLPVIFAKGLWSFNKEKKVRIQGKKVHPYPRAKNYRKNRIWFCMSSKVRLVLKAFAVGRYLATDRRWAVRLANRNNM